MTNCQQGPPKMPCFLNNPPEYGVHSTYLRVYIHALAEASTFVSARLVSLSALEVVGQIFRCPADDQPADQVT